MAPNIPEDTIDDAVISTIMGGNDKPIMTATESEGSIVSRGTGAMDPDIENIPTAGLKCDLLFNVFQNRAFEEPEFMRRLRVILQFNVLKNGKQACIWTADNKSFADVICYREPARGVKPDCIVAMDDDDIFGVMLGKINPQRLFMRGKIKVKGNVMLMQRLNTLWIEFQKLGKAPEIPLVAEILLDHPLKPGLKSEFVVIELIQRIVRIPSLFHTAPGIHQITITKDGKEVAYWLISLIDNTPKILRGQDPKATSCMMIDDVDFARLVLMKMRLNEGIANGRILVRGEKEKLLGLDKLFSTPTSVRSNL